MNWQPSARWVRLAAPASSFRPSGDQQCQCRQDGAADCAAWAVGRRSRAWAATALGAPPTQLRMRRSRRSRAALSPAWMRRRRRARARPRAGPLRRPSTLPQPCCEWRSTPSRLRLWGGGQHAHGGWPCEASQGVGAYSGVELSPRRLLKVLVVAYSSSVSLSSDNTCCTCRHGELHTGLCCAPSRLCPVRRLTGAAGAQAPAAGGVRGALPMRAARGAPGGAGGHGGAAAGVRRRVRARRAPGAAGERVRN